MLALTVSGSACLTVMKVAPFASGFAEIDATLSQLIIELVGG